jgi:hypothetical protein
MTQEFMHATTRAAAVVATAVCKIRWYMWSLLRRAGVQCEKVDDCTGLHALEESDSSGKLESVV